MLLSKKRAFGANMFLHCMTMGHKVIKHPCLQISTPADLKTLQWVWARNKVTAYKAPLYTKNDQELKPFIWKLSLERSCPGVHITCLIRKSCIWILNKAGPPKSMQLNSKQMISKQLPSAQGSLLLHQICSESVHLAHIRWTNFRHNWLQGEYMQGPSGNCSLRDIVHFGPMCGCAANRRWASATLW